MKKVAVIFPGQGSQYVGMGRYLYENYEKAKEVFEKSDSILDFKLSEMIFHGKEEELKQTEYAQLAIYTTNMAAYAVLRETCEIKPVVFAGHSLGEISALTAAEVINYKSGLELIRDRAQYMKEASDSTDGVMYAIRNIHYSTVENICNSTVEPGITVISNYNAPSQVVISGDVDKTRFIAGELEELGALITKLKVSGAFHSPHMNSARIMMENRVKDIDFHNPNTPVIANVNGAFYTKEQAGEFLSRQVSNPVQWVRTLEVFEKLGVNAVVEVGAGKVLSNLLKTNDMSMDAYRFEKSININKTIEQMNIHYKTERPNIIEKCISIAACTKNYNDDIEEFKLGVQKPVRELKRMTEEYKDCEIDPKQRETAIELLDKILKTKGIPDKEQEELLLTVRNWDKVKWQNKKEYIHS